MVDNSIPIGGPIGRWLSWLMTKSGRPESTCGRSQL